MRQYPVLNYAIALTGGIASGKSTALTIFRSFGMLGIEADAISHQQLNQQAHRVKALWGSDYVIDDGTVNRQKLGQLIFNDQQEKKRLEALLHPLIKDEIYRQAAELETQKKSYFIDIPLFFEYSNYPIATSVLIYCPRQMQKERLLKRNHLSTEEAFLRIDSQLDIEEKKKRATFIIDNSGSKEDLTHACDVFLQAIDSLFFPL